MYVTKAKNRWFSQKKSGRDSGKKKYLLHIATFLELGRRALKLATTASVTRSQNIPNATKIATKEGRRRSPVLAFGARKHFIWTIDRVLIPLHSIKTHDIHSSTTVTLKAARHSELPHGENRLTGKRTHVG